MRQQPPDQPPVPLQKRAIAFAWLVGCMVAASVGVVAHQLSRPAVEQAAAETGKPRKTRHAALTKPSLPPAKPRAETPVLLAKVDEAAALARAEVADAETPPPDAADLDPEATSEAWSSGRPDTYRTVCVRLCDGAFHPISFSTTRDRFKADQRRCEQDCQSPARLYVYRNPDGSPDDMVDLRGRPYADLPTAFRFRTAYDSACSCRKQPRDADDRQRHDGFTAAANGAASPSKPPQEAPVSVPQLTAAAAPLIPTTAPPKPVGSRGVLVAALPSPASDAAVPAPAAQLKEETAEPLVAVEATDVPKRKASKLSAAPKATPPAGSPKARTAPRVTSLPGKPPRSAKTIVTLKPPPIFLLPPPVRSYGYIQLARRDDGVGKPRSYSGDDWRLSVWEPKY